MGPGWGPWKPPWSRALWEGAAFPRTLVSHVELPGVSLTWPSAGPALEGRGHRQMPSPGPLVSMHTCLGLWQTAPAAPLGSAPTSLQPANTGSCGSSNFLEQLLTLTTTTQMWQIPGITHSCKAGGSKEGPLGTRALSLEEGCGNAKLASEDGLADRPRWTFTVCPGQPGPCEGLSLCCDCVRSWCCPLLR